MSDLILGEPETIVLFQILDEEIGVFRFPELMNEERWKYWALTRERFINTFTTKIPPLFWFQGTDFPSVNLVFDSTGFRIEADVESEHQTNVIEKVNKLISDLKLKPTLNGTLEATFHEV